MLDASAALSLLPSAFTSREAFEAGLSQAVLERLVRRGAVSRVQRGVFRQRPEPLENEAPWATAQRHYLARARGALIAHPHHALSHETAAIAWGWPVLLHPGSPIHLTALHVEPRSRRDGRTVLHHSDSVVNDALDLRGLTVMPPARVVADCLRTMRPSRGVAVADAAVRAGMTFLPEVESVLTAQRRWRGRPRAREALRLVDPRRDSWLESFSFCELHGVGIELPTPQVEVYDTVGRFVARVDGIWVEDGTVAEADGKGKYGLPSPSGEPATQAAVVDRVLTEKAREDALRSLGLEVVRWDFTEIRHHPERVASRVRAARARGDLTRFTGSLRHPDSREDTA
ncbi:MAG: type IV toxin-antitoxin system AbiEi family antitoxin domain-containing protein [Oryzihumus sp.]